ncbi:hypothetical protein A2U01_0075294, partial [Trifolium medium]|nr:hypothetical protein [Trifolium medium]
MSRSHRSLEHQQAATEDAILELTHEEENTLSPGPGLCDHRIAAEITGPRALGGIGPLLDALHEGTTY